MVLSTKVCQTSMGSIMGCHVDSHSHTISDVHYKGGVLLGRIDMDVTTILLPVEVVVLLVHYVLRVPAKTQVSQKLDQHGWMASHTSRCSLMHNLPHRKHLKEEKANR